MTIVRGSGDNIHERRAQRFVAHTRLAILVVTIAATIIELPAAQAAPKITFTGNGAIATGIKRGGDAIWFVHSVSEFSGSPLLSRRVEVSSDGDLDEVVALEAKVRPSSVWVVVDLTTGEYAIATPNGEPVRALESRENAWVGGRAHLDFDISDLDVLLVRPGRGAWTLRCMQGGPNDGDRRADGNLRVKLADMEKVYGSNPSPPTALPRDLLVAIEPTDLATFVRDAAEVHP